MLDDEIKLTRNFLRIFVIGDGFGDDGRSVCGVGDRRQARRGGVGKRLLELATRHLVARKFALWLRDISGESIRVARSGRGLEAHRSFTHRFIVDGG